MSNPEKLEQSLDQVFSIFRGNGQNFLFDGASKEQIETFEQNLGLKLPLSYKSFLAFTNGAYLYQTEEFFGTENDPSDNHARASVLSIREKVSGLPAYLIPFHRNNVELHCFDTRVEKDGEYQVVKWDSQEKKEELQAATFVEWIEKFILQEFE